MTYVGHCTYYVTNMAKEIKTENAGAALVRLRWEKATPEERAEAARKMVAGRKKAQRKRGATK